MAADAQTVERIRRLLSERSDVVEKTTIGGGLGFMVGGHLCCSVTLRGLTVRVGRDGMAAALEHEHVSALEFGGRRTAAFVVVAPEGYRDGDLRRWVEHGLDGVATLDVRTDSAG